MSKKEPRRDRRTLLINALREWGSAEPSEREVWIDRILSDDKSIDIADTVGWTAGLDIESNREARALLYLLCLFAFTNLPKGATKNDWKPHVPVIKAAAGAASVTKEVSITPLVSELKIIDPEYAAKKDDAVKRRIERA